MMYSWEIWVNEMVRYTNLVERQKLVDNTSFLLESICHPCTGRVKLLYRQLDDFIN